MGILDRISGSFNTVEEFAQALASGIQEDINASVNPLLRQIYQVKLQLPSGSLIPSLSGSGVTPSPSPTPTLPPVNVRFSITGRKGAGVADPVINEVRGFISINTETEGRGLLAPAQDVFSLTPGSSVTLEAFSPIFRNGVKVLEFGGWIADNELGEVFELSKEVIFTYIVPNRDSRVSAVYDVLV